MATPSKKTNQDNTAQNPQQQSFLPQRKQYGRQVEALEATRDPEITLSIEQALDRLLSQSPTDSKKWGFSDSSSYLTELNLAHQPVQEVDQQDEQKVETLDLFENDPPSIHGRIVLDWSSHARIENVFNRSIQELGSRLGSYQQSLRIINPANEQSLIGGPQGPGSQDEIVKKWTES